MKLIDYIIIGIIILLCASALAIFIVRRKKGKSCCSSGCAGACDECTKKVKG